MRITYENVRQLEHEELLDRAAELLGAYDKPVVETQHDKVLRIERTLDEMPQIYRWFLQLESFCDQRADFFSQMGTGAKNLQYKHYRQRRDLFRNMASAAKMRYGAASRMITVEQGFDPTGLPQTRRVS